jgi:hypothetical protein
LGTNKVKQDAAHGAFATTVGEQHATVGFELLRLGDECVRPLRADGADGAPNRCTCACMRFAKLGGDGGGGFGNWVQV